MNSFLTSNGSSELGNLNDVDLLQIIGVQDSVQHYRGSLKPFFHGGEASNQKCAVAKELVKRWMSEEIVGQVVFPEPSAVAEFLKLHFAGRDYESFVVLFLDSSNRLLCLEELFRGTLTQTSVYPREVVKASLRFNAAAVMFAHNHPSGVTDQSRADETLTHTLKAALALVDVRVLDHLIIGGNKSLSFAERGLI